MKIIIKFLLPIFILSLTYMLVLSQNSTKRGLYNGHVENVQQSEPVVGTITVNVTGFGKSIIDSKTNAIQSAFYVILFRGVPGSKFESPLISDESKNNDAVVEKILNKDYNTFTITNIVVSEDKKSRKIDGISGYQTKLQLTVNVNALRSFLEVNNVIRKFGF